MHRIDAPGNLSGHFTEGDPQNAIAPTTVSGAWLEDVQESIVQVIESEGIALVKGNGAQLLDALHRIARGQAALRNVLINGDFSIIQRETVGASLATGVAAYVLDRWRIDQNNSSGNVDVQQLRYSGSGGGSSFPTGSHRNKMILTLYGTNLANPVLVQQRVEDVRTLGAAKATLSCWIRRFPVGSPGATTVTVTPRLRQYHGGGASDVLLTGTALVLPTTVWQHVSWTFDVPEPGAIGTSSMSYLEASLRISGWDASPAGVELVDVQLERGGSASLFEELPLELTYLLAARYYEKSLRIPVGLTYFASNLPDYGGASRGQESGTIARCLCTRFRVPKVKVPTVTWYSPETAVAAKVRWNSADVTVSSTNHTTEEQTGEPVVGSSQSDTGVYAHWTADAEL